MIGNPQICKDCDVLLNGQEYRLSMRAAQSLLSLELESKYDAQLWKNTYTQDYVEELTKKTGSAKKFPVFVNILATAFNRSSDHVFFEILSYQDLEQMKQQRLSESRHSSHSNQSQSSNASLTKSNKRYLILSYQNEFENIHYPLALIYEEQIDNSRLINKIQHLKTELFDYKQKATSDEFQATGDSFRRAKRDIHTADAALNNENDMLKAKVKRLEEQITQKKGAVEINQLMHENDQLHLEISQLKRESEEKHNKLQQQLLQTQKDLVMQTAELTAFRKELTLLIGKVEVDKRIQEHIQHMNFEEELQVQKQSKLIQRLEKEIEGLNQQIDFLKKQDTIQKRKITQLETEISQSMKRFNHRNVTDRLYSPYSNHSNTSKRSYNSMPNNRANSKPSSGANSPNISNKNSRNSTQNSGQMRGNTNRFQNQSPVQYKPAVPKRPTAPAKPVATKPRPAVVNKSPVRSSPTYKQPIHKSPLNQRPQQYLAPNQGRQNYQQTKVQAAVTTNKPRTNQSAQNYQQAHEKKNPMNSELDAKISNLRSLLQKAKY